MGPLYAVVHSTMKALHRKCPKCHRVQVVPRGKVHQAVSCARCGASIPAKKRHA